MLVPFDGSEPARAALRLAIGFGKQHAAVSIVTIVDEMPLVAQSTTAMVALDPAPLLDALDEQGQALLDDAAAQCRAEGVKPALTTIYERHVAGILAAAADTSSDVIIMGTHARTGVARTFLGSTTEGVLRASTIPVLTVRNAARVAAAPFATVLLALDDSEPADAAAIVTARLVQTVGSRVVACHAIEPARVHDSSAALSFGFPPMHLAEELRREALSTVDGALTRAGLPENTPVVIVDGDPAEAIVATANARGAGTIVAGTHGRRGLRRFALGSVAENVVRKSEVPVLIVPAKRQGGYDRVEPSSLAAQRSIFARRSANFTGLDR
ncbi:MAG TPA: universal stress protein [Candidatus Lustribacter sp.]|nr:universal stress protein [Candidatus Lustribacter sp.]